MHSGVGRVLIIALLVLGWGVGCVSRQAHQGVVTERDRLTAQNARLQNEIEILQVSAASLGEELETTLERQEDLLVAQTECVDEVSALRQTESRLGTRLADQSVELVRSQQELETARAELERLTTTYTTLMSDLESEVASGQIQIEQLREGIRVNVSDDILFASGSTRLDPVGQEVLNKLAGQLLSLDHHIEVQGHTDDRPVRGNLSRRFPSNWELAAARAGEVVRLFQQSGIHGERLTLVSFAAYNPIAPNEEPQDRAQNRRIEIRLKPRGRSTVEPSEPAPAASADAE
ncbi:OmpA family protein [Myxococcota bacterium]|nr:OmpA family protein [Myxococcota bacterium]